MSAKLIGNRGTYRKGGAVSGLGIENIGPVVGSYAVVSASEAGQIVVVSSNQVSESGDQLAVRIQSEVNVSIRYSLSNPALGANPDPAVRASAMWTAPQAIAANDIEAPDSVIFVCAEITFSAPGSLVIHSR